MAEQGQSGMSEGAAKLAKGAGPTNGTEAPAKREELELDLDGFSRDYVSYVTVKAQRYGILSLIDVPNEEALEAIKLDVDIREQSFEEQIRRTRRQIEILVPDLRGDVLAALTTRQMLRIAAQATGVASRPTGADPEPPPSSSASASPVPAPAASIAGATAT